MSKFFINRPIFAIVISIIIVAMGIASMLGLPIEQYPNITPPMVRVTTSYTGADATTVDNSVATPIGQDVMGVSDMLYLSSTSGNDGSMNLNITFDIGTDPDINTILTQNRVSEASALLPESVKEQGVVTLKSQTNFMMVMSLFSDGRYDAEFLTNYAYINIRNQLLKINGVGSVTVMGAGEYSMRIWLKPDKMAYLGLTIVDIEDAIEAQAGVYSLGKIGAEPTKKSTAYTYTLVTTSTINNEKEFSDIILRTTTNGTKVRLKDVANVELGCEVYGVSSKFNGKPCAAIMVTQSPGSNAVKLGGAIVEEMDKLSKKFPDGLSYKPLVNATTVISDGINEIIYTLIFVIILVMLIVFIFLQNARATLIPLIAIPVSLIGTFIFFPLFGLSFNIFSLLAIVLAVGLVVDDAIVVVEASQLNIENGMAPLEATKAAMKKVSPAIIGTTVVLIAVFIPLAKLTGITGLLFTQFSITIAISFLISAFNALTLSPALCSMLLRKEKDHEKGFFAWFNRVFGKQKKGYLSIANKMVRVPRRAVIAVAMALIMMTLGFKYLPNGFLPEEDDGYLMMVVSLPPASSMERTQRVTDEIQEMLADMDFVDGVISVAGYNLMTNISSSSSGALFINLKDWSKRSLSSFEIADKINQEFYMEINSAEVYAFGPPSIPGLGTASGFSLELLDNGGNTPQYMQAYAQKFMAAALKRPEISLINNQFTVDLPQKAIIIDDTAVERAGIDLTELHETLSAFLGGSYVNNFNRFGQLYETYIQASSEYREDITALDKLFIANSSGNQFAISNFATLRDTVGVEYITRYNMMPSISLTGSAGYGYSTGDVIKALESVASEVLPDDMSYEWSNMTYQEVYNSGSSLPIFFVIILFVFLILAALYENWAIPFTVIMGIPFAIMGCLLIVFITHLFNPIYVNNVFFQISLVVLIALSAKNAILIVEYANTAYLEGETSEKAGMSALDLRYRPIIMTSLAFMIGAAPLIFASGPYSIARNIIGVAMFGGMLMTTFLAITIYPALYKLVAKYINTKK